MKITDNKPELFQRSDYNIWTEPYIQQQMLYEHLNPESDGASRNRNSILKIVGFINEHIKPGIRLLDLGCGPGLYAELLKDQGYEVTGIDFNKVSINYARQQRKDIYYIHGDYIRQYPKGTYDMVMMIYCDMGTHSDHDRDTLLRNIHGSLTTGGKLIFDVFTEELINDKQEGKNWDYNPSGGFWSNDEYVLLSQTFHYPQNRCFAYQYNLLTKNKVKHFIVWERYYSETEIISILREAGFRKVTIHPHILDGNNFTSNNEMFIVAEK
ncbi:MAG: class I SAM-dependent methyltransferase [Tannerella sp.]|jgi:SAM-dependent methyltransferase|nr:class I SAM-dependent methyltransferase [Tannerella sp.]